MKKGILAIMVTGAIALTGCASAPEKPDCNLNVKSCLLHWDDYVSHKRTERNQCVNDECFEKGEAFRQAESDFIYALYLQGKGHAEGDYIPR